MERPFDDEGVTCSVCHSIESVATRGIGSYVLAPPAMLVREDGTRLRDASDAEIKADLDSHKRAVMRPLIAIVTDRSGHPVANTSVTFTVQQGGGHFAGGGLSAEAATDEQGHASARYVCGAEPGPQMVRADFAGNTVTPVVFLAEGLKASQTGITSVSGVVLDQNMRAAAGIDSHRRAANADGRGGAFRRRKRPRRAAPTARSVEVIGRDQIPLPGRWPNISYDMDVLPSIDNHMGRPLFLPRVNEGVALPLDSQSVVTRDTVFELPVVVGEPPVKVTARAGTRVTFPPDVTDKRLSVTRIATNRIPMALEDGRATNLYISMQPSKMSGPRPPPSISWW